MERIGSGVLTEWDEATLRARFLVLRRSASAAGYMSGPVVDAALVGLLGVLGLARMVETLGHECARCGDYLRDISRRSER